MSSTGRPCVVCGSATAPLYRQAGDYFFSSGVRADYVVCESPRCRTVQQEPLPEPERIGSFYGSYYTHARLAGWEQLERRTAGRLVRWLHRGVHEPDRCAPVGLSALRRGSVIHDVGGIVPGGPAPAVLDVGCGNGASLLILSVMGYASCKGVETDERACEAARALGFEVRPGTAESIPYPDESFDVVYLRHVIEHVLDPARAIAECLRVLRPGGLVSFLAPNAAAREHARFGRYWRGLESPRHLHIFTPASLAAIVARGGAEVLRTGATDRSKGWMARMSRRAQRAHEASDPHGPEPFFEVAPELDQAEELFVIARRGGAPRP